MPPKRNPSAQSYCMILIRKDVTLEPKLAHPKKYPVVKCQRESQRTRINMRFHRVFKFNQCGLKCTHLSEELEQIRNVFKKQQYI